jgi:hypothetical protein
MKKARESEELIFGKEAIDLSPSGALERAESFLARQGYVVVHRTLTTMMAVREGLAGPTGQGRAPKVVVVAVPQPDGGVSLKVRGDDREGVQGRQGLWKLWAENLPKRRR